MNAPAAVPADAAARARAVDPSHSFIVEAPAGSGKTTLLTQRFLGLLARTEHPESVLAITFTRKATGEMRDKIVDALERAATGAEPRNPADAETLKLARVVLKVDAARGWALRAQPTRLRIQTIDSLNHWLAARLPILSRAGASLAVSTRPEELYARAARRTIAELDQGGPLGEALAIVLEHLDNQVDSLEPLLAEMLARRERWLRYAVPVEGAGAKEPVRAAFEDSLASLIRTALERAVRQLALAACSGAWALTARAAARLAPATAALERLAATGAAGLPTSEHELAAWQAFVTFLLTQRGEPRKTVDARQGFPPQPKADKLAMKDLLADVAAAPGLVAALREVAGLPPPCYDEAQWRVLLALNTVLLACATRLAEAFAAHGAVDFPAVQRAALDALGPPDEPTDLNLELDYRLQHILVDEFQDTSRVQLDLLARLTAGWQDGDGRTLFLVGDPMQSIYGFREADVGIFLEVRRDGLGGIVLEPLTLSANFRSRPAIVEWVNAAFRVVLPAEDELTRGAVRYSPSTAVRAPEPDSGVIVRVLEAASAHEEAAAIAVIVASERQRQPKPRIAVLAQSRATLSKVAAALRRRGVPFQGVKLVALADRPAVRDLIALTRALAHPADRIAWLACLRAPWCGLTLESLLRLAGDDGEATLGELILDPVRLAALEAAERARLERTVAVLEAARADRGRRPLAECVEAAWLALGGPATATDAADLDNADAFLAELDVIEEAGDLDDPVRLAEALTTLYAAPEASADPDLQLMTIHGAKGLEWDVVVLAGLGRSPRGTSDRLLRWLEFTRADGGAGLVLAPRRAGAELKDRHEEWLKDLEKERRALELGRLLYVATTRARERLYLAGHVKARHPETGAGGTPTGSTLLARLWPVIGETVALEPPRAARAPAPPAKVQRLVSGWQLPEPAAGAMVLADPPPPVGPSEFEFEWVGTSARHVGTVVHEELERLAERPLAARAPAWRRRLIELGVADGELARALERVGRALEATLADPRGRWLFDATHTDVGSELELSTARGEEVLAIRIDRSFVDAAGVRWIIDYKTSVHEGADVEDFLDREQERYRSQLENYAQVFRRRDPRHPIRLGLYFPLLGGWRDWAAGDPPPAA